MQKESPDAQSGDSTPLVWRAFTGLAHDDGDPEAIVAGEPLPRRPEDGPEAFGQGALERMREGRSRVRGTNGEHAGSIW
jgi:hypothetical protein